MMTAGLMLGGPRGRGPYGAAPVTDEDIARGYQLERVSTNAECSFAFPTNGVLCGHWHQRGAYDDVTCVDFGDWMFQNRQGANAGGIGLHDGKAAG